MSSVPSVESIIDGFPNLLPKITGQPTYETLKKLRKLCSKNAASYPSLLGSSDNGHLGLYNMIAPGTPFIVPVRPTPTPVIPFG